MDKSSCLPHILSKHSSRNLMNKGFRFVNSRKCFPNKESNQENVLLFYRFQQKEALPSDVSKLYLRQLDKTNDFNTQIYGQSIIFIY